MLKIFSQIVWKGAWIGTMMLLFCTSLAARQKQEITFELIGITENQPVGSLVAILHEEASKEGTFWRLADDHLDNQAFRIQNDSVFSAISFDFETDSLYHLVVELWQIGGVLDLVSIPVIIGDLRGKFDQNGVADDEVAAFYPGVNVGDYLFLQPNVGKDNLYYGNGIPAIHYPNRIYLKAAVYDVILINLESVEGISGDQPVIITNFLGQV